MHKSPSSAHFSRTSSKRFWTLSSSLVAASLVPSCGWAWAQDGTAQNITLQSYQRELVYIPELCNATGADVANGCSGAWVETELEEASNSLVTTTFGPAAEFENIVPQVYLIFRASAIYIKTSDVSNATANLTVSSQPSGGLESTVITPLQEFWTIQGIDESQLSEAVVTFIPEVDDSGSELPTRLDIDFIKITVSNISATESALPSQTISTSVFTPVFATFTTVASSSGSNRSPSPGSIVGATIGGMAGFLLICGLVATLLWRRHRRKRVEKKQREKMARQAALRIMAVGHQY
ncbi:hypothetical protein PNOK_0465500 [Pyrrhoderma noxium]|uniref:Uncharacterized protein n=1 Tax=Pyrrhoderma noxium TaxID=2282107 RepID=A0A286UJD3_9AGAM|nr:hypothetical protein PNOK_0465500 [Pyrrhoderma noxium]